MTAFDFTGRRICVAGLGISGAAAARVLLDRGAHVVAVDGRDDEQVRAVAKELRNGGAEVRLGDADGPIDADLVVTSPGWRPSQPLLVNAQRQGIEVIGEPELAWRLRPDSAQAWLGVTGTNGKTTTVGMLAGILAAAGHHATVAGNVGTPLVDAVVATPAYDVLAVEMSSFQLHWSPTLTFAAAGILNIAEDHLDWHGSMAAYVEAKAAILRGRAHAVLNHDDEATRAITPTGPVTWFTVGVPEPGQWGVRDGWLVDGGGAHFLQVTQLATTGQHNVANALAAGALAAAYGVPSAAIAAGLSAYRSGAHRNALVATIDDVDYVNDSKATNAHAAAASLSAYEHVVWIAGGLLKGASVDELVRNERSRLRAVVLIGAERERIRDALARHAPDVPVVEVVATDTGAMTAVVSAAARLALPGDTVLLAPAAASMDMFRDYAERGEVFAAAVRRLAEDRG